ncbi:hypothetical protein SAMN04488132_11638 [Sediminibacterium ginsengisoli]|uniref:Uncharacterized protein n=1 Tax=Sediminibacterium ginsengisoli TaxID=413434 RepID=A0A1T4PUR0_9BACT|nr:hypothetical protein SAMN04488132_106204 [Sediminibacterium ginsengisoli]SKA20855.1 hypothetical protein SAMN04488132_11638 [Sediminibacterium ginsengisoli]
MKSKTLYILAAVVVAAGAAWYFFGSKIKAMFIK